MHLCHVYYILWPCSKETPTLLEQQTSMWPTFAISMQFNDWIRHRFWCFLMLFLHLQKQVFHLVVKHSIRSHALDPTCKGFAVDIVWTVALWPPLNAPWWKNLGQDTGSIPWKLVSQGKDCKGKVLRCPWKHASTQHQVHPSIENAYANKGIMAQFPNSLLLPLPTRNSWTNIGSLTSERDDKYHSPVAHLYARLSSDRHNAPQHGLKLRPWIDFAWLPEI